MVQTFFKKQKDALDLLHGPQKHIMLYGGRRSGKTYLILSDMVAVAYQFQDARMLVARQHFNHVKTSIWEQTLPDVLKYYPVSSYRKNNTDLTIKFCTGSEIRLAGLDEKQRIEKNLGTEYCIVYCNECSTISYDAVLLIQSSLAQNIIGFQNKMYYDMNPPPPTHWTYKMFEKKIEPRKEKPLPDPNDYISFRMNPMSNPHLSKDYINKTLESLPDREKRRYKYGEYVKVEGCIYDNFNIETNVIDCNNLPKMEYFIVGIDNTGNNLAAVLLGFAGDYIYLLDEYTAYRATISEFDRTIQYKWRQYHYLGYADPAAGPLNDQMWSVMPADNAVAPGIEYIRQKIENKQLLAVKINGHYTTPQLLAEMDNYRMDDKGRIIKEDDHLCDGMRYGIYTHFQYGGSILSQGVQNV